ncbi:MAG: translation initiation factor, partial [Cyanobacteriota bacterium]
MNNGKVRIYELSKELNLDNKDIKEICEQLNIAVKSHSSTITVDDAQRVRSVSTKSPRTENNNDIQKKGNKALKVPAKRKQQILAVHHRTDNSNPSSRTQAANSHGQSPKLVAPPSRPQAPNSSGRFTEKSSTPAKPSQAESGFEQDEALTSITPNLESESSTKVGSIQPPRLTVPPSRPQAKKSASRNLIQSPSKPKIRSIEPPQNKIEEPEPEEKKKKVIAPLPKLNQRPQKIQAVSKVAPKDEVEDEEIVENLDGDDVESDDLEVKKVTRLKRPAPPKKVKEWENEEEDESKQAKLGKGKAAKKRRGPKPILDDEDFDDSDANAVQINEAFSLSTARPAKPKSMQQEPAATVNKKPRKPSFKTEKTQKNERQTKGKAVPTLSESIILTDNLTVRDLADRLNSPETDIIRNLFFKGISVNITQTLDLA